MAQLRQDYEQFVARNAEIVVVGPESQARFQSYWQEHDLPYVGLANPDKSVLKLFGQQVRVLRLGRLPALVVVSREGRVIYQHKGNAMHDIPSNERVLALLDELNATT